MGTITAPGENIPRVMIACPVYSAPFVEFVTSLMRSLNGRFSAEVRWLGGDSLVPRARNNLAHEFLKTRIPFLLQIDTDLEFLPEHLERLIMHPPKYGVIGGCYPKKRVGPPEWICNGLPGTGPDENGLQPVAEMGTGLLRIHRSVFAAVREAYPQLRYYCDGNKDIRCDFFPVGTFRPADSTPDQEARYLSEDWYISQLARAIGYTVWADTRVVAGHWGKVRFPYPPEPDPAVGRALAAAVPDPAPIAASNQLTTKTPRTRSKPMVKNKHPR